MSKYIIIGGVAGGATAAARLRRLDEHADIIVIERGPDISYATCGLPYYIGGVIKERDKLFVKTPQKFSQRFNIDVRILSEAIEIKPADKKVKVKNLATGQIYEENYDKLILSPGAAPIKPQLPGINEEGIFTLRTVDDADRINKFILERHPRRAVVVGGGFIGLEMAENLCKCGIYVTIIEMAEQVMVPLDYEMAAQVHQHLKSKNVEFYLNSAVSSFIKDNEKIIVKLSTGNEIQADFVILSIGVKPENTLAKNCGLKLGNSGGIWVNEYLQTSQPDIYAIGDAIEFVNPVINQSMSVYLAGPANKHGRIAADNVVKGNEKKYEGTIATAIAKVFDITVASTGINEKTIKKLNIPYFTSITHNSSHAGYYPDALPMSIKLVFSAKDGKIFGAQIVGYRGVDKRIDLISAIIKNNGTIYDLEEIEHSYAPPYSSAKDPINIAGFAAENILNGSVKVVNWHDLLEIDNQNTVLIDVRTPDEYSLGTIEGAINIQIDELRAKIGEIPKNKKVIVFCSAGLRGYNAARILMQNGFTEVYNLSGGYKTYDYVTGKQSNEGIFEKSKMNIDDIIYQDQRQNNELKSPVKTAEVDACGLQCPGPIIKLKQEIEKLPQGEIIQITASDPGFMRDVKSWCNITRNKLISLQEKEGKIIALIQKAAHFEKGNILAAIEDSVTLIVFSDSFDKVMASFVIANGAAATGKKVTMFFTFWGLSIIKKSDKTKTQKDFMAKMFNMMMPKGSSHLKLSKLNMFGTGPRMMRSRMKSMNIDSLEEMIKTAINNGVELIACQMTMEVMGIKKEELRDGVVIGGVASYLEKASKSNVNLFI